MIETTLRDYLISKISSLTTSNCFVGNEPTGNTETTFVVISTGASPLSDSHNTLATKLTIPKGINQRSVAVSIYVQSDAYSAASNLIWSVFNSLGGYDGGCIVQDNIQMFITPVEAPYHEKDIVFRLNFVIRTPSV